MAQFDLNAIYNVPGSGPMAGSAFSDPNLGAGTPSAGFDSSQFTNPLTGQAQVISYPSGSSNPFQLEAPSSDEFPINNPLYSSRVTAGPNNPWGLPPDTPVPGPGLLTGGQPTQNYLNIPNRPIQQAPAQSAPLQPPPTPSLLSWNPQAPNSPLLGSPSGPSFAGNGSTSAPISFNSRGGPGGSGTPGLLGLPSSGATGGQSPNALNVGMSGGNNPATAPNPNQTPMGNYPRPMMQTPVGPVPTAGGGMIQNPLTGSAMPGPSGGSPSSLQGLATQNAQPTAMGLGNASGPAAAQLVRQQGQMDNSYRPGAPVGGQQPLPQPGGLGTGVPGSKPITPEARTQRAADASKKIADKAGNDAMHYIEQTLKAGINKSQQTIPLPANFEGQFQQDIAGVTNESNIRFQPLKDEITKAVQQARDNFNQDRALQQHLLTGYIGGANQGPYDERNQALKDAQDEITATGNQHPVRNTLMNGEGLRAALWAKKNGYDPAQLYRQAAHDWSQRHYQDVNQMNRIETAMKYASELLGTSAAQYKDMLTNARTIDKNQAEYEDARYKQITAQYKANLESYTDQNRENRLSAQAMINGSKELIDVQKRRDAEARLAQLQKQFQSLHGDLEAQNKTLDIQMKEAKIKALNDPELRQSLIQEREGKAYESGEIGKAYARSAPPPATSTTVPQGSIFSSEQ